MARIAWLGTGMMGSAFVEALRRMGDDVVVWNRSRHKAERLSHIGASVAHTPREAVSGADIVHSMLADDATVDALLDDIEGALKDGTPLIDHTTVAPAPTVARAERCKRTHIPFLHAPVFAGPQAARNGEGVMLCSGPRAVFERLHDHLHRMTADLWYLGERPDAAAALKLCGNLMLFFVVAGLRDTYALAKSVGIPAHETYEVFQHFNPTAAIASRGRNMANGDFTPAFEAVMARKDARLMLETAARAGVDLAGLPAIARQLDAAIERGDGHADFGVIARDVVAT